MIFSKLYGFKKIFVFDYKFKNNVIFCNIDLRNFKNFENLCKSVESVFKKVLALLKSRPISYEISLALELQKYCFAQICIRLIF
jgi:hypothetical protein